MKRIKKNLKRYIAFLAVLIILVSITVTPVHAAGISTAGRRLGAWVATALMSLNTVISAVGAPIEDAIDYITSPSQEYYTYFDAWQDRPTLAISPDVVTIDGVDYTDVWLSNEAAEKFRVDAFDFMTEYSVVSNSNAIFASGYGSIDGMPLFYTPGYGNRTQNYEVPYALGTYTAGNSTITNTQRGGTGRYLNWILSNNNKVITDAEETVGAYPIKVRFIEDGNYFQAQFLRNGASVWNNRGSINKNNTLVDHSPFEFDWVSGTIPANQPLPQDYGIRIRVPSHPTGTNYDIIDYVDDHPEFAEPGGSVIDVNLDPNIMLDIDDLADIIIPLIPLINTGDIVFEPYVQPVPPVQDTLLPDTWWSQLENKLTEIINAIQNFSLQPVIQAIQTIPSAIQTLGQNITQAISNLGDTILQDIEQGPIKVIDKALDKLKSIFLPILANLRNALGIWHYVVEWINGISAPFTWIFGIVQGGMSFIMVPIYATIAGWIVIMVYKRFGR